MVVEGCFDEVKFPEDNQMIYKGGLVKTVSNMGKIKCNNAADLFSVGDGMVSVTLRFGNPVVNGVYTPISMNSQSANSDMILFVVNPSDVYFSYPGVYAALTPSGIEFSIWSLTTKISITDRITNIEPENDVTFVFCVGLCQKELK